MSALLSDLRGIGLTMGGSYSPTSFTDPETKEDHVSQLHLGYTTDPEKAEKAGKNGRDGSPLRWTASVVGGQRESG